MQLRRYFAAVKIANPDPLTRPTPADESAVACHPLPQEGEGIFVTGGAARGEITRAYTLAPLGERVARSAG